MAANQSWVWIDPTVILAVHEEQLAEHGGGAGVRDAGAHLVQAQRAQVIGHDAGGAELAVAQLRVGVKVAPPGGHTGQHGVALGMAEAVVEGLEVVYIDHQQQHLLALGKPALQRLVEMAAVGDAGQHVGQR